jgi:outer membrane lipoprotein carrier protein
LESETPHLEGAMMQTRRFFPLVALGTFLGSATPLTLSADARAQDAQASSAPSANVAAENAAAKELVDRVQAFYDKTTSFRAEFQQEFIATLHNKKTASNGTVAFVKPGKMSWRYASPAGNRIVSNGVKMRVYEAANQQMFESPVDKAQYPAALSFLTGQGKLWESFNFELKSGAEMKFDGGSVLVGTPKTASPAYKKVLFYVDTKTAQVRRVLILDNQGSKNRFDFIAPKVNEAIGEGEFVFEPPANTSIVKP